MEEKKSRSPKRPSTSSTPGSQPEDEQPTRPRRKRTTKAESTVSTVQVQIAVDDAYLDDFAQIVKRCRELGLEVEQELPDIGVFSGRMPADKVEDAAEITGVYAIERPRSYRIAPPTDNIQ